VNEKREVSVAVFYVHRMNYVNARFGSVIGDKILFVCSQHLATALVRPTDALYRWKGPAFVAILEREPQTNPENDIQRLLATPLSQYLETPSRTVYLPIKLTGRTVPQTETSLASMRDWIEGFILRSSLDSRLPD
jgi:GGDEF domain-containing protein